DFKNFFGDNGFWAAFFIATFLLLGLGMTLGVAFRSKSWWLAIDLALVPISIAIFFFSGHRLFSALSGYRSEIEATDTMISSIAAGFSFLLLVASAAAVLIGRTDIRRAHRALSITFWSVILFSLIGFDGFTHWVVAATPKDLSSLDYGTNIAPQGDWAVVSG